MSRQVCWRLDASFVNAPIIWSQFEKNGILDLIVTKTEAEAVATTTIYVRLKEGLASGDYDGTITLTSTGADNVIVNLSGSVVATASLPFSWTGTSSAGSAEGGKA